MKLKKKNILVIAVLAVAGLFGTASAVLNQKVNEEPVAEKAEAAGGTVYLNCDTTWNDCSYVAWTWKSGGVDGKAIALAWIGSDNVYSGNAGSGYTGFKFFKCSAWRAGDVVQYQYCPQTSYDQVYAETGDCYISDSVDTFRITSESNKYASTASALSTDNGTYLTGSFNSWAFDKATKFEASDDKDYQVMKKNIQFASDTQMKVYYVNYGKENWGGNATAAYCSDFTNYPTYTYDNSNAWISNTNPGGTFDLYVNTSSNVYYFVAPTTKAEKYGTMFLDTVVCSAPYNSVPSGWGAMETEYKLYGKDLQGKIYDSTTSAGGTDLQQAMYRYDYIVHKYGTSYDFIGRATGSVSSGYTYKAVRDFSPFKLITDNENNLSTIIIIAASSVALLSVTALSILVIKKRKNKEE